MKHYGNGNITNGLRRNSSVNKTNRVMMCNTLGGSTLRQSNTERSLQAKKRVIRMLFVVVMEFFVCWTPMYVMQTWRLFDHEGATHSVTPLSMNMIHLLSYVSSCCNPITYCFMNRKFRQGFLSAFRCCRYRHGDHKLGRRPSDYTFASQRTGMVLPCAKQDNNSHNPVYINMGDSPIVAEGYSPTQGEPV